MQCNAFNYSSSASDIFCHPTLSHEVIFLYCVGDGEAAEKCTANKTAQTDQM